MAIKVRDGSTLSAERRAGRSHSENRLIPAKNRLILAENRLIPAENLLIPAGKIWKGPRIFREPRDRLESEYLCGVNQ